MKQNKLFRVLITVLALLLLVAAAAFAEGDGSVTYRALLIGVDNYSSNALSGCVTDANRMSAMLQASNEAGVSYQSENITVRTNLTSTDMQMVLNETSKWEADEDDVTFFYFSGHGYYSNTSGEAGLVGKDGKSVGMSIVRKYLDEIPGTKLIVLDMRFVDSLLANADATAVLEEFNRYVCDAFRDGSYSVFIASTKMTDENRASSLMSEPCGISTVYLAEACGYDYLEQRPVSLAADVNSNGATTFSEARDYVTAKLSTLGSEETSYTYSVAIYPENGTSSLIAKRGSVEIVGLSFEKSEITLATGRSLQLNAIPDPQNASTRSITWSGSDLSVIDLDGGLVTGIKPGSCRVMATAPGGYSAAVDINVVDVTFIESLSLNWNKYVVAPGTSFALTASIVPENATEDIIWTSTDESIAMVDKEGFVTAMGLGLCTITCSSDGGAVDTCTVQVVDPAKAVTDLAVQNASITLYAGEAQSITYKVKPTGAMDDTVHIESEDETIVMGSETNRIVGVSAGSAKVKMIASSGVSQELKVTVKTPVVKLNEKKVSLKEAGTATIKATVTPTTLNNQITWASSDESVASVDQKGKITAGSLGTAVITATAPGGATATCEVTVHGVDVTGIKFDTVSKTVTVNETFTINATIKPDNASLKSLKWASSNEAVATVSDTGYVTATASGKTIITATSHNGKKAECKLVVKPIAVTELSVNETSVSLVKDIKGLNTFQVEATTQPVEAGNGSLKWKSSNKKVAVVNASGLITAVGPGKAIIRAQASGNKKIKADIQVTVTANRAEYKSPVFDENEYGLYTSAKKIGYMKETLCVQLFFYNYSSKAVKAPQAGKLVLTLADGTTYELMDIAAGSAKIKSKKVGTHTYKISTKDRAELAGLDLRGATATIVVDGAEQTTAVETPETEIPAEELMPEDSEDPFADEETTEDVVDDEFNYEEFEDDGFGDDQL